MRITYHGFRNGFAVEISLEKELPTERRALRNALDSTEAFLADIGVVGFSTPSVAPKASERAAKAPVAATPKPTAPRAPKAPEKSEHEDEPLFAEDGTPICPRHGKPMTDGPFGYYCRTKCTDNEPDDWKNKKGYCNYKAT